VVLTETVPDNTTFNATESTDDWSCADGSPAGTSCTLDLGTLDVDASRNATFAVTVVTPFPAGVTTVTNTATVADADDSTSDMATAETDVTATSDLRLTKDDSDATATPGGVVTYTLTATNLGSQDATGVVLTDTIPGNTAFNDGQSDDGWACTPTGLCTFPVGTLAGNGFWG
jgi:uncharacterized repeat protein (TIGR01451 family)